MIKAGIVVKEVAPLQVLRDYRVATVKAINDGAREITGMATTPAPDRIGDIVDPKGAQYRLPIPLLHQHRSEKPVGEVYWAKVTKDGIEFKARIAKVDEPGELQARTDLAWQELKAGLIKGVSIGFRTIEFSVMDDGGWRFMAWEWLELSLVTIPANAEATIDTIRSLDPESAARGIKEKGQRPTPPARRDPPTTSVQLRPEEGKTMTIAERIQAILEARKLKLKRMDEIMKQAGDANRSTDAAEQEEYDNLERQLDALDADLKRLKRLETAQAENATVVVATTDEQRAAEQRGDRGETGRTNIVVRGQPKAPPGVRFARVARCLALGKRTQLNPIEIATQFYKSSDPEIIDVVKANVLAGATITGNWAANLVSDESGVVADFVEYLRPQTIVGRFGQNGIPDFTRIPFRTPLVQETSGGSGYWVGEGKPKPLTSFGYGRSNLEPLKVANICVLTMELLRDSRPSAEVLIRNALVNALRERIDLDFIDADKAAVAGISPASIINGITAIPSTGASADSIREDIRLIMSAFAADNNSPLNGVWIMSAGTALALGLMRNTLGQQEFPGINVRGGTLEGFPVLVSEYVNQATTGNFVILVNASDVYFADDGEANVDMSSEASLQMLDNPTNDSVTPTATTMVSMFQTNSVAFRAERTLNWARRRDEGVQWLNGVTWGQPGT